MDKKDIISISKRIRKAKDEVKKQVREGKVAKSFSVNKGFRIIDPPHVFTPSLEMQSDKWYFNGFLIDISGKLIVVDPGVDFYSRFSRTGLNFFDIKAVIVTHGHTDHIASLAVFIEKILRNEIDKKQFFISKLAFENELTSYHQNQLKKRNDVELILLKKDGPGKYALFNKDKIEFISLHHSYKDTFGFKIEHGEMIFGCVSDTGYAKRVKTDRGIFEPHKTKGEFIEIIKKHDYIKDFYSDCRIVALNINDLHYNRHSRFHMSGWDVLDLFKDVPLRKLILFHLSPISAKRENGNYIYRLFFKGQLYKTILPRYVGRVIKCD